MTFVIAEIGVNHNGDIDTAKKLIDAAKAAGADACKFQTYDADTLEPPGARRDMLAALQLSPEDHKTLKGYADQAGIEFMATPFDQVSLAFLVDLGVKRIKISSGDLLNTELVGTAITTGLPIILSTGAASLSDVSQALKAALLPRVTVLHCLSAYPAPVEDMNLKAIRTLSNTFGVPAGFSDHSTRTDIGALAVAAGATIIEKHLTLDASQEGPDHASSIEPKDFTEMVRLIREAELIMGDGIKRPMASEAAVRAIVEERAAWRVQ